MEILVQYVLLVVNLVSLITSIYFALLAQKDISIIHQHTNVWINAVKVQEQIYLSNNVWIVLCYSAWNATKRQHQHNLARNVKMDIISILPAIIAWKTVKNMNYLMSNQGNAFLLVEMIKCKIKICAYRMLVALIYKGFKMSARFRKSYKFYTHLMIVNC